MTLIRKVTIMKKTMKNQSLKRNLSEVQTNRISVTMSNRNKIHPDSPNNQSKSQKPKTQMTAAVTTTFEPWISVPLENSVNRRTKREKEK